MQGKLFSLENGGKQNEEVSKKTQEGPLKMPRVRQPWKGLIQGTNLLFSRGSSDLEKKEETLSTKQKTERQKKRIRK